MSVVIDLKSATKGLVVTSESDAPLKPFVWKGVTVDSQAALLAQLKLDAATPVTELSVEAFFAPFTTPQSWHTDEDKADLVRFTALVAQLSTLTDPKEGITRCINHALVKMGRPELPEAEPAEWAEGTPVEIGAPSSEKVSGEWLCS